MHEFQRYTYHQSDIYLCVTIFVLQKRTIEIDLWDLLDQSLKIPYLSRKSQNN